MWVCYLAILTAINSSLGSGQVPLVGDWVGGARVVDEASGPLIPGIPHGKAGWRQIIYFQIISLLA